MNWHSKTHHVYFFSWKVSMSLLTDSSISWASEPRESSDEIPATSISIFFWGDLNKHLSNFISQSYKIENDPWKNFAVWYVHHVTTSVVVRWFSILQSENSYPNLSFITFISRWKKKKTWSILKTQLKMGINMCQQF